MVDAIREIVRKIRDFVRGADDFLKSAKAAEALVKDYESVEAKLTKYLNQTVAC